jgi:hypothetical protein
VTVKLVKRPTHKLIAADRHDLGRCLIQMNDGIGLIEDKSGLVEAVDYRCDTIITIAKGGFYPHRENSASKFALGWLVSRSCAFLAA